MNEMRFPAAFLQGIYYNSKRPQYLNFGGIGSLIGHEMTHGFDRQGRNFDEKGKNILRLFWFKLSHIAFDIKIALTIRLQNLELKIRKTTF